jgi:hypothetical protein
MRAAPMVLLKFATLASLSGLMIITFLDDEIG